MTAIYLRESDVEKLVTISDAIESLEGAFQALAAGTASNVPRTRAMLKGIVLHSMSAAAEYLGMVGWKQYTTTREGARFLVGLYGSDDGRLVALIEADRLGQLRTGAATGLAAKYLALPNATRLGLFGSGWQAESQLKAVVAALPIKEAVIFSRNSNRRNAFVQRMADELSIHVQGTDQPRAAVDGMPIVITATSSREPVLDGDWLGEGTFVAAIGSNWKEKAEVDRTTVQRAHHVVCDSVEACRIEAGDLIQAAEHGTFDWSLAGSLAEVVTGSRKRSHDHEIILFKSVGLALEDVAFGHLVYQRAKEAGVGERLPF